VLSKEVDFEKWWFWNWRRPLDLEIEPYLKLNIRNSWLRDVRKALNLSTRGMAARMRMDQKSYWRLEVAEADGRITLTKLRRCAEAMDCEVVYALRPKSGINFSRTVWAPLPQRRALHAFYNPRYRRIKGWARNIPGEGGDIVWLWRATGRMDRYE
jgi:transcriptional regulator with XRE-family HTH domain